MDLLLVAIPKDVTYLGKYRQAGSPLTKLVHSWSVQSDNWLARLAKVPYDLVNGGPRSVPGMVPGNHRFMTPGHDPLAGLVVGVFDLLRGGRTAIGTDGLWQFDSGTGDPVANVALAIVCQVAHLLSDVATPAGLPGPLMTLVGAARVGSFGDGRTLADLARYMYLKGYDVRHFVTTCTAPAASRLVLAGYFAARQFVDNEYREDAEAVARRGAGLLDHPKLVTMRFYADAMACAGNAGKIALYQGNPSA